MRKQNVKRKKSPTSIGKCQNIAINQLNSHPAKNGEPKPAPLKYQVSVIIDLSVSFTFHISRFRKITLKKYFKKIIVEFSKIICYTI